MDVSSPILQGTLRAVRCGCERTHTVRDETLRAVRCGCGATHTAREDTLSAERYGCGVTHTAVSYTHLTLPTTFTV